MFNHTLYSIYSIYILTYITHISVSSLKLNRVPSPGDVIVLPDDEPEAALEACQRACLEAQKAGFVPGAPGGPEAV